MTQSNFNDFSYDIHAVTAQRFDQQQKQQR